MPEVLEPPVRSARELSNHGGPDRKALDGSKNVAIEASLAPVPLNQSRETMEPATITALASHRPSLERAQSSWRSAHDRLHLPKTVRRRPAPGNPLSNFGNSRADSANNLGIASGSLSRQRRQHGVRSPFPEREKTTGEDLPPGQGGWQVWWEGSYDP